MDSSGAYGPESEGVELRDRVYRFALRLTGDLHRAEDVAQETVMRVLRAGVTPTSAYAFRVARHLICDEFRSPRVRRSATAEPDALPDPRSAEPLPGMVREETRRGVWTALGRLPEKERIALVLRFGEGASCTDIAAVLDLTPNAVSCLLHRAKQHLRDAVDPEVRP